MFDVYYIGENYNIKNFAPFAKKIDSKEQINPRTKMYWLIEPNIEIIDHSLFSFRPSDYDHNYEHVWKWNPTNYGGVRLIPTAQNDGVKQVNQVVCKKCFDIIRDVDPQDYFDNNPYATHVWCIDSEYKIDSDIDWAPDNFEPEFVHSFHLRGQLEHKYPEKEGGVKLYPRNWKKAQTKYHRYLDASVEYPVVYTDNVEDYTQRDIYEDDYVWLIDREHCINKDSLDWVPNPFEEDYNHVFRMPYQLEEKYPEAMGGIHLVHRNWKQASLKIHQGCPIEDENYDVFYTNKGFSAETFEYYAKRSDTDWFWVIDREYDFNGKLLYVPAKHEDKYIHVFKWGLEHRYLPEVTELWDERVAGIYLVHKDFDITQKKLHTDIVPVRYDIFFTNDMNNYERYSRLSRTEMFWLVDEDHSIVEHFTFVPEYHDQKYINIFKIPGQLEHKYPKNITNVSDNRCGGLKLVPKDYNSNEVKYQGHLTKVNFIEYDRYATEEEGRQKSTHPWFWVVDQNVDVLDEFEFDYIPDTWDAGKTHVWQKLNPVTGRQYDYHGVKLCAKEPVSKGRPKYIREPACTQKRYPVYYLEQSDYDKPLHEAYARFESKTTVDMYWVVDAYTKLNDEFDFDFYPTQWDKHNVHVFANEDGEHTNVRLVPNGTFTQTEYTDKQIANNSFDNLKLINTIASLRPKWPVVYLDTVNKAQFVDAINSTQEPFVWTVDPDVDANTQLLEKGYMPKITDTNKVHAWQKTNPRNGKVHAYGGVRLWPTSVDYSNIKTSELKLNRIRSLQYVKEPGSTSKAYEVVFLSHYEPNAENAYTELCKKTDAHWVKDVDGIFEAHKAAANKVESKMFWVVDADAIIDDEFDFSYIPDVHDEEVVHVWNSVNPVTGQEYGYGGVKLFPTHMVKEATSWGIDFTTGLSTRFKAMPQVSCTTAFNTDEYSTWRSAFRECVKLTLNSDTDSKQRLNAWLEPIQDAQYADYAKKGAQQGKEFALANKDNPAKLALINDYNWLKEKYSDL